MLFISSLFFCVLSTVSSTVINTTELTCPPGWFRYRDSCYFFDNPLLEHDKAEIKCWEMGSTLLVAETLDEYELITDRAKESAWSWVGLTQSDDLEHHIPQWSTSGGVDPILINWLVKPYLAVSNGWTTQAKCAAHLNVPAGPSASYTFFLPCTVQTYSICEKNATLFPRIWEHGLIGMNSRVGIIMPSLFFFEGQLVEPSMSCRLDPTEVRILLEGSVSFGPGRVAEFTDKA